MKNLDFLKNKLIAHRGYHDIKKKIPENSIAAFKRAIRFNYPIEIDVHLTKDNKLVVFHDYSLKRVCGVNKKIEECTYSELLKYNLFDTKYKIPLFKEVLKLVEERNVARKEKNWQKSDELRGKIQEYGYRIEDSKEGTEIEKIK